MEERLPRKLAAILYADVAGYSRLTGEDEMPRTVDSASISTCSPTRSKVTEVV
jgi:class 3 adenylate cyclase